MVRLCTIFATLSLKFQNGKVRNYPGEGYLLTQINSHIIVLSGNAPHKCRNTYFLCVFLPFPFFSFFFLY